MATGISVERHLSSRSDLEGLPKRFREITCERLRSLEPGEGIVLEDLLQYEALSALGSPSNWEIRDSTEGPPVKLPGPGSEGQADNSKK